MDLSDRRTDRVRGVNRKDRAIRVNRVDGDRIRRDRADGGVRRFLLDRRID